MRPPWDKKQKGKPSDPVAVSPRTIHESLWPCPPPTPEQIEWDRALAEFLSDEQE